MTYLGAPIKLCNVFVAVDNFTSYRTFKSTEEGQRATASQPDAITEEEVDHIAKEFTMMWLVLPLWMYLLLGLTPVEEIEIYVYVVCVSQLCTTCNKPCKVEWLIYEIILNIYQAFGILNNV